MDTPKNKPNLLRVGLSRTQGSIKKKSSALIRSTPSTTGSTEQPQSTTTTPMVSTKITLKKDVTKKKKLEFAAEKHLNQEEQSGQESDDVESGNGNFETKTIKALLEEKKKKLEILERYQAEKEELTHLTERWKQAGLDGIERLRQFIDPSKTDEEILDSFNIPHEVFLS